MQSNPAKWLESRTFCKRLPAKTRYPLPTSRQRIQCFHAFVLFSVSRRRSAVSSSWTQSLSWACFMPQISLEYLKPPQCQDSRSHLFSSPWNWQPRISQQVKMTKFLHVSWKENLSTRKAFIFGRFGHSHESGKTEFSCWRWITSCFGLLSCSFRFPAGILLWRINVNERGSRICRWIVWGQAILQSRSKW